MAVSNFSMKSFELESSRGPIAGVSGGTGPPVIMIAGLGASHRIWGKLPQHLSRGLRVFAIDNRGIGGSRNGETFNLEGAARDILRIIEYFDLDDVRLVGVSLGGLITLQTAVLDSSCVRKIVVASCAAHLSSHGRRSLEVLRDLFVHLPPERAGRALMSLAFAPDFHQRFPAFVEEAILLYGPHQADIPGTLAQAEDMLSGRDLREDLRGMLIPSLVLAGTLDPIVAPADTAEIAALMPDAKLTSVPGAAHAVIAEGGVEVFNMVESFLGN